MSSTKKYLIGITFLIIGIICFILAKKSPTTEPQTVINLESFSSLQAGITQTIDHQYSTGQYTLSKPLIIQNPYKNSALSYLVKFKTEQAAKIQVVIEGKTPNASIRYETDSFELEHDIQLIGLYPNHTNAVNLIATYEDGTTTYFTHQIVTNPIENMNIQPTITSGASANQEFALYLINDDTNKYLIDCYGDVRWIQESTSGSLVLLKNGNLLTYNKSYFYYYQVMLQEIDFLGQIHTTYYIPGAGHHSLYETNEGNILINSSDKSGEKYIEDVTYLLDRETGDIISQTNLRDYLDVTRFEGTLPQYVNESNNDWYHLNYAMIDETDGTLIASGRSQSMVVKVDEQANELKWIMGPHDNVSEELQPYLLTPVGDNFTWQFAQHSAKTLPDIDENPDTTDLILFDNHVDIGVFPRKSYPDLNQYSRGVHYRINEVEMTVELVWEFGRDLLQSAFSSIISEIDYIQDANRMLVLFGFVSTGGLTGGKLYEVNADDEKDITFSMDLMGSGENHIYTAQKITLDTLNLSVTYPQSDVTVLGTDNMNAFKSSSTTERVIELKPLNPESIIDVSLQDNILKLSSYIPVRTAEENLTLGLRSTDGTSYEYSIHPFDIHLVTKDDITSESLAKYYKRELSASKLVRFTDFTDLSSLPNGKYELYILVGDKAYDLALTLDLK